MVIKTNNSTKTVTVRYFAILKEQRGLGEETIQCDCQTLGDLYEELKATHGFSLPLGRMRVALQDQFVSFDSNISDQDVIIFVPPVSGG